MRFDTTWKKANLIRFGRTSSWFKLIVANTVQFYRMPTLKNWIIFVKRNQRGDFIVSLKCRQFFLSPPHQALQILHYNQAPVAHKYSDVPMCFVTTPLPCWHTLIWHHCYLSIGCLWPAGLSRGLSVTSDTATYSRIAARWSQKQLIRSVQQAMEGAPQRRGTIRQVGQVFGDTGSKTTLHEVTGFRLRCCGMWRRWGWQITILRDCSSSG
jgi:hypothetical protein